MPFRCARCHQEKPVEAFSSYPSKKRDCYCKPCRAEYGRAHYLKNKRRYVEKARERTLRELQGRYAFLLEYFLAHPCSDCGETDPVVLEFDHLSDKSFGVAYGLRSHGWASLLREIEKCEVVCANCHRRRTARRMGTWRHAATSEREGRLF